MNKRLTLVLGGVRAGKSSYAQRLATDGKRVLFVATAEAGDPEMAERIRSHRESRPSYWDTLEEPIDVAAALAPLLHRYDTVLLDCLTLWISNLLLRGPEPESTRGDVLSEARKLLELYRGGGASWIIVSNEVGTGRGAADEAGPRLRRRARSREPARSRRGGRRLLHGRRATAEDEDRR